MRFFRPKFEIDGVEYSCIPIKSGVRLRKKAPLTGKTEKEYFIHGPELSCTCLGFQRWGHCKHLKVLTTFLSLLQRGLGHETNEQVRGTSHPDQRTKRVLG